MLRVEGRFDARRILDDTFIVTVYIGWFALMHRDTEASELESQMLNSFEANLQCDELCGEGTRFDSLLFLAVPYNWGGIKIQ